MNQKRPPIAASTPLLEGLRFERKNKKTIPLMGTALPVIV
jgi:hypothetical protein